MAIMKQANNSNRVDKGWQQMNDLLNQKMPHKKKRKRFAFLFLFGLMLTSSLTVYMMNSNLAKKGESKNQAAKILSNKTTSQSKSNIDHTLSTETKTPVVDITNPKTAKLENDKSVRNRQLSQTTKSPNNVTHHLNSRQPVQSEQTVKKSSRTINKDNINKSLTNKLPEIHQTSETSQLKLNTEKNARHNTTPNKMYYKTLTSRLQHLESINPLSHWKLKSVTPQQNILNSNLLDDYVTASSFIKPNSHIWRLHFGINSGITYLTDFSVVGYDSGVFLEMENNNKWGVGLKASYQDANITASDSIAQNSDMEAITSDSEMLDIPSSELGALPGGNNNGEPLVIQESQRAEILKAYTTKLNALKLVTYAYYKPNKSTRFSFGIGFNKFFNSKSLNNVYVYDETEFNNTPTLTTVLFTKSKIIPLAEIGFSASIYKNLSSYISYNHTFSNIINETELNLNTNSIHLGLNLSF